MLRISLDSPIPLHDQLVAELRRLIATGKLPVGAELPPVRQLAGDLGINLNTVARAYRELTDAGLLSSARGRGTRVLSTVESWGAALPETRQRVEQGLSAALANAKIAGFSLREARAMLERELERMWKHP
jgi:DNA-binding transcriptional regulator YhcF (GntR family)